MKIYKSDSEFNAYLKLFIVYILGVIAFLFFVILGYLWYSSSQFPSQKIELDDTGIIGDTMGGIMGPLIAIGAALFTFLAFWVQYKANKQQRDDIQLERFEDKFYELLRLHKENVNEVRKINKDGVVKEGRQLFNTMYRELEFCYKLIHTVNRDENRCSCSLNKYFLEMAYNLFYFGIGQGARVIVDEKYKHDTIAKRVISLLSDLQELYHKNKKLGDGKVELLTNINPLILHTDIPPFHGYIIGHYYRHLFQTIKFVDNTTFLTYEEKYSYTKILRAQLTDFEQAMLYYNAVSGLGKKWLEIRSSNKYGFLVKYRMIHNALPKFLEIGGFINDENHEIKKQIIKWEDETGKYFFELDEGKNID